MAAGVYAVSADFSSCPTFESAIKKNVDLRAEIFDLAQQEAEEIFFHRYDDGLEGAPHTLVECSPAFLDKIKKLPLFGAAQEPQAGLGTFRAGHAGPVDASQLKRVLALQVKAPSLATATTYLQDDILDLAKANGVQGQVLIRHVDGDRGFLSLLCPDSFVDDVKALPRCKAIVKPEDAVKIRHQRPPKP